MRLVWFREKWHAYERVDGRPKRTSLGTTSREIAARRLIDLEQTKQRKATTAAEMHDVYLEERGSRLASQETLHFAWKRLSPVFGHLRPDQITRALTRAYAAKEGRRGISDGSIRRDLGVLSAILRYNDKNSPAVIDFPPAPPPRSRYLTREQYRTLRDAAARTPHLHLFVILAYTTAGRSSAILELTWDRIDYARGEIQLGLGERRSKGRASVPMHESAREALEPAHRAALTDYAIEYGSKPVRSVKRAFARAAARAGIPWCTPHVLRHTAAVHMAESGVPMAEIAQYLGHSSESVTYRVYARFSPSYLRRAASALE
jgi:integrase